MINQMDINRKTAFQVLKDVEIDGAYSNLSLNNFISENKADNPAFVRELVYGVLKRRKTLDFYLEQLIASGLKKVKKSDLILLRMGAYQLKYMDSVPEYAAVNETMKLARAYAKGRDKFINGVLRNFTRKELEEPASPEIIYSMEKWIIDLWEKAYGPEETLKILSAMNDTPELSIRVNLMKTDRKSLRELLENEGFAVKESDYSERALMIQGSGLLSTEAFAKGMFSVQDISSIVCSDSLETAPGMRVVDMCAAPGGKTIATAELMNNQGSILACDIYEHKLQLIENSAERAGIEIIETMCHDGTALNESLKETADRIICDVPCSGLGVFRRKPEIKYKKPEGMKELYDIQKRILDNAAEYLKRGGIIVYSTCTINPEENGRQIEKFMERNHEFELVEEKQFFPYMGADGFYIAKMRRKEIK